MSFTEIKTQEELDKIIGERLSREREANVKKYEGYLSPDEVTKRYEGYVSPDDLEKIKADYDEKIKTLNSTAEEKEKELSDMGAKIKGYEAAALRNKIAIEAGLPYTMADRLKGDKEEDIRKDAQALSEIIGKRNTAPLGSPEPVETEKAAKRNAYRKLAAGLKEG